MSTFDNYQQVLKEANLRVTPQRIAVLEAFNKIKTHPSADEVASFVSKKHPSIAFGTIYNVLDSFVSAKILKRVKTDKGAMLYDAVKEKHHHLYCNESDRIEDYRDEELDRLLEEYFKKTKIEGFNVEDIKLQIVGTFNNK